MENFFKKLDKMQKEMSADIEKKQVLKQSCQEKEKLPEARLAVNGISLEGFIDLQLQPQSRGE